MFKTLSCHFFQVNIRQIIGFHGPQVFVRQIGARYAFIVGRQGYGNTVAPVDRERVGFAPHAQNYIVRRQADFHQDVALRHLAKESQRLALVHHGNAMSDSFRVAALDRFTNVETEAFGGHQPHGQLSGVQADVHFGIDAMQIVEHAHVQIKIMHRHI